MIRPADLWRRFRVARRLFRADPAVAALLAQAESARREGRWGDAARLYRRHAQARPRRVGSRIQLGNMLKEAGDFAGAEAAYHEALALRATVEAWSQLGYLLLTTGRPVEAADAFAAALALNGDFQAAKDGMIRVGRRDRLARADADPETLERLRALLGRAEVALNQLADAAIVPMSAYDAFRKRNVVSVPSASPHAPRRLPVRVDGRGVAPYRVRATLLSLIDQTFANFVVTVLADEDLSAHPVAALALSDPRISFSPASTRQDGEEVVVEGGAVLSPEALAWLVFAADRTRAEFVYSDHDHQTQTLSDIRYHSPVLHPAPDPDDLATTPSPPVLAWRRSAASDGSAITDLRMQLVRAAAAGEAAHLPLILSSVLDLPPVAAASSPAQSESQDGYLVPRSIVPIGLGLPDDGRELRVIIPTRDEQPLLAACLDSLRSTATRPDRVHFTVVDNGSRTAEMKAFLASEKASGRLDVLSVPEPFNWCRLNRLGVVASHEPNLLLLNNDTEMVTPGWDVLLSAQLARPEVGVVGARLLYPDGTLQHAGIVLGLADGTPRHEGVGSNGDDGGPCGRWNRTRAASAVTGAFMGMRREVFDVVGGFDDNRLAIAYNDIDFCLRCRSAGLSVLFDGSIELVHHESRTRGLNDTRARIAWDIGEWGSLHERWGAALLRDPAVNPHWATTSLRPFDGVRAIGNDEAIAWLDRSITTPWVP